MKKHVHYLFIDALENQLHDEQKLRFYSHLKSCPVCAQEFDDVKTIFEQTGNTIPPEPSEKFWDQYWLNLQVKLDKPKGFSTLFSWVNNFSIERELYSSGYSLGAGTDEAGRGPLAGPVVAACVILPRDCDSSIFKVMSGKASQSIFAIPIVSSRDIELGFPDGE